MKAILELTIIICTVIFCLPMFIRGLVDLCKVLANPKKFDELYDEFIERNSK